MIMTVMYQDSILFCAQIYHNRKPRQIQQFEEKKRNNIPNEDLLCVVLRSNMRWHELFEFQNFIMRLYIV